jgi:aspartyl aminopeptidase
MIPIVQNEQLVHRLVNVGKPILSIPSLAIHLDTDREKFEFNKDDQLKPILSSIAGEKLNSTARNEASHYSIIACNTRYLPRRLKKTMQQHACRPLPTIIIRVFSKSSPKVQTSNRNS